MHTTTIASPVRVLTAGLVLLTACATASAQAYSRDDAREVRVSEKIELASPPGRTWDAIQDFMSWPTWHPAFASTVLVKGTGNAKGTVRLLTAKDGAQFTEELLAHDDAARSYKYRILESPAPVSGYVSTLEVRESRGGSMVTWSSTFKVKPGTSEDDAKKAIAGIYRLGLDHLGVVVR